MLMQLLVDVYGLVQGPGTHKVLLTPGWLLIFWQTNVGSVQVEARDVIP